MYPRAGQRCNRWNLCDGLRAEWSQFSVIGWCDTHFIIVDFWEDRAGDRITWFEGRILLKGRSEFRLVSWINFSLSFGARYRVVIRPCALGSLHREWDSCVIDTFKWLKVENLLINSTLSIEASCLGCGPLLDRCCYWHSHICKLVECLLCSVTSGSRKLVPATASRLGPLSGRVPGLPLREWHYRSSLGVRRVHLLIDLFWYFKFFDLTRFQLNRLSIDRALSEWLFKRDIVQPARSD